MYAESLHDFFVLFAQEVHLDIGKNYTLKIRFDPGFKDDLHIRTIDEVLNITYKEHPHIVSIYPALFTVKMCVYHK